MVTSGSMLEILARDGEARLGVLHTPSGDVDLPAFMPVGTAAAVKGLTPDEVRSAGFGLLLANTYHLVLRPGVDVVERAGGIARFMSWRGPVLTDSGGYQILSLAHRCKVSEEGVRFQSHIDGSPVSLTPEEAYSAQLRLGADVAMALDVCLPSASARPDLASAASRTTRWLERTLAVREPAPLLFGIVQGGVDEDLRLAHLAEIASLPVDGVALGGLSVGEDLDLTHRLISAVAPRMPAASPRYLMGMGRPEDILHAVRSGIDLFDCVLPTRNARNGQVFTSVGRYSIKWSAWRDDSLPLDPACSCPACRSFDRRYLRHLFVSGEILSARLLTLHNLTHYASLMAGIRSAIRSARLDDFARETLEGYARGPGAAPDPDEMENGASTPRRGRTR